MVQFDPFVEFFREAEGALEREKSPKASSSKMEEEAKKGKEGEGANSKGRKKKVEKKCEPTCSAEVRRWKQVSQWMKGCVIRHLGDIHHCLSMDWFFQQSLN